MTSATATNESVTGLQRLRLHVRGAVQGVGFRPFVHRLATSIGLAGFVHNNAQGVVIEVEGPAESVEAFCRRLSAEAPPPARLDVIESSSLAPTHACGFSIAASQHGGPRMTTILPDLATCTDCVRELFDPADRRYRYPFTNCTHCGPRFSIIEAIPYDRPNTSMRRFTMCPACQAEYDDPADRRFHAQPNACPTCGPRPELWNERGAVLASRDEALLRAADAVRNGQIVAVKGIGGFHLFVDARDDAAVRRLRLRKQREEKPLALMMPGLAAAEIGCEVSEAERRLLLSSAAPIVLLTKRSDAAHAGIASSVAPGNPRLGVMLPYSPLHHLLMRELGFPVVATSGNRSDEPICTDEREAVARLAGIADRFLVHDRPIVRPVDDSVVRIAAGREMFLRRSRGYTPLPVGIEPTGQPVLALGGHLKSTVALAVGGNVFLSQHVGDLETPEAFAAFERATRDLPRLYEVKPTLIACDAHPDYRSTQHARQIAAHPVNVQHHHAHVAACMAEHGLGGEVLGVSWDGSGWGPDGTIWGGEFLRATRGDFQRAAHLRTFALPGGSRAIMEPRRSAFGVMYDVIGADVCGKDELALVRQFSPTQRRAMVRMIERGVNSPRTSSAGRLFDAVAALIGLRQVAAFEGQAAMELECAAASAAGEPYPFDLSVHAADPIEIDWRPMVRAIIDDLRRKLASATIAERFHATLAEMILAIAELAGLLRIVLGGGCFQNVVLLEAAIRKLHAAGFEVFWPRQLPPNDGGLSFGQVVVAAARRRAEEGASCV